MFFISFQRDNFHYQFIKNFRINILSMYKQSLLQYDLQNNIFSNFLDRKMTMRIIFEVQFEHAMFKTKIKLTIKARIQKYLNGVIYGSLQKFKVLSQNKQIQILTKCHSHQIQSNSVIMITVITNSWL